MEQSGLITTPIRTKNPNNSDTADKKQSREVNAYLRLLSLEKEIRSATDESSLHSIMLNRLKSLIHADYLVLFKQHGGHRLTAVASSDVSGMDHNSPFVKPLEALISHRILGEPLERSKSVDLSQPVSTPLGNKNAEIPSWFKPATLLIPLIHPDGRRVGFMLVNRRLPFSPHEQTLADHIAQTMAHAWQALIPVRRQWLNTFRQHNLRWWFLGLLTISMFIPVRLSVLAPAEVVADQPELVVAPLTGVIKEVLVTPHEQVTPGQPLIRFEDTDLRNRLLLVEEELLVSEAQLLKVRQQSFLDGHSAEQIAELQARVNLKKAELSYSRELLERSTVSARQPGIAVFRDKSDWIGKPVQQGERIFYIADPGLVELQIFLTVRDAITLTPGTKVKLFLDTRPLEPLVATLTYASYDAEVTPEGILAYRLKASLRTNERGSEELPRIGLQGTAKLYGEYAPLAMYLLRRPLAYLRQWIGF